MGGIEISVFLSEINRFVCQNGWVMPKRLGSLQRRCFNTLNQNVNLS